MDVHSADSVLALAPRERLFTAEEYHALARVGVLSEDDRVELLNGRIVLKHVVNPAHFHTDVRLIELFTRRLHPADEPPAHLSVNNPVNEHNEPEPDLPPIPVADVLGKK